ncbi:helix-turn-helix domain-containing protein, partial [Caballeronia sp. LZ034LL]|uniref:helix-turn-helix domain-containing protein n=1 Tax=Caballeronia sp. LZ034LL TaxID=3038567 RepID=UPI003857E947
MRRARKPWLSLAERQEIWALWRKGESVSGIARTLQRDVGSMHRVIAGNGGITPAQRTRAA